jgi:superfamily II DNA or RNA helicase
MLHQTRQELEDWLKEPVGIIGESKFSPKRVTVGTIQTLSQSSHTSEYFDWSETIQTMVVDELHVMLGNRSFKVLEAIQPRAVYGLTASLQMTRKEVRLQVYAFSGPVLFNFPISEGQKLGVLAQGAYISVKFPETIPVTDQTAATIYSAEVVCNKKKTDVVHSFLKKAIGQDKYAVVLCERIKHVHNLSVSCSDIEHQLAYGEVKVEDRQDAQKDFEVGDIKLIIANKVFKKGVNIKRLDLIMDVAEMSNPNDVTQKFGRGVRLHKDKESLLYIDIGTKGSNNLGKAAKARKRAAKKLGVPCYELLIEPTDSVEDIVEDLWALSQKALGKLPVKATS